MDNYKFDCNMIEDLRNKLAIITQERDSAVEMWKLAEIVANNVKEELKTQSSLNKVETLKNEMETMQQDYSDAIKLLEFKVKSLEKELKLFRNKFSTADEEVENLKVKISYLEDDKKDLEINLKKAKEEKEENEKELRQIQKKFDEATEVAIQARDKVKDALAMAQDALSNEANLLEEKKMLEKRLNDSIYEYESKLEKEINSVKSSLNTRIETLANQLQGSITEKNQLSLGNESLKAEYNLKVQEANLKYNSLNQELQEIRSRRQFEIKQWGEEREMLRKQLTSLQIELENTLMEMRKRQESECENCVEMKIHLDKYRFLAKEWEEAAYSVTQEFQKYNSEVKKLKGEHVCNK